jgi:MFS family permease
MFIARFFLGIGIGPKSATAPIYAAECAPPAIRGALVMQWQLWTAFGIMLGFASDLLFYNVSSPNIAGLNWRLMMGSAMFPAVIVCLLVSAFCPESPRWHMSRGRHAAAYGAMCELRFCKVQAARDIFYMAELLRRQESMHLGQSKVKELLGVARNRRALLATEIVMFMQQVRIPSFRVGVSAIWHFGICPSLYPRGHFREIPTKKMLTQYTVLRNQHNRILLVWNISRQWIRRATRTGSFVRLRCYSKCSIRLYLQTRIYMKFDYSKSSTRHN